MPKNLVLAGHFAFQFRQLKVHNPNHRKQVFVLLSFPFDFFVSSLIRSRRVFEDSPPSIFIGGST
jgi:hypothetical protein